MSKHKDGGPAFGHGDHCNGGHPGMSLRDWFAGQALAGLVRDGWCVPLSAEDAYLLADAMLIARENGGAS